MDSLILQQYKTLLKLRFKLLLGTWSEHSTLIKLGYIFTFLTSAGISLSMAFALGYLMHFLTQYDKQLSQIIGIEYLWVILFGFLSAMWLFAPVMMSLQDEGFQMHSGKLLQYPISLRNIYGLNLLLGLLEPWSLFFYPILSGVMIGGVLAFGLGKALPLLFLIGLFFIFHVVWSRLIMDLLATLFAHRRTREIVAVTVILMIIVIAFIPAFMTQELNTTHVQSSSSIALLKRTSDLQSLLWNRLGLPLNIILYWSPAGFFSLGLKSLFKEGFPLFSKAVLGLVIWIVSGNLLAIKVFKYMFTVGPPQISKVQKKRFRVNLAWPAFVPVQIQVMAAKELKSLYRSVLGKLCFFLTPIILVILRLVGLGIDFPYQSHALLLGVSSYIFMTTMVIFTNYFGFDMDGFKNYLILPVSSKNVILGKNLALGLFTGSELLLCLYLYVVIYPPPSWSHLLYVCLSYLTVLFGALSIGNFFSIRFPVAIDLSQPNQKRQSHSTFLALNFLSALLGLPVLALWFAHWMGESPLMIISALMSISLVSYVLLLDSVVVLFEEEQQNILSKL